AHFVLSSVGEASFSVCLDVVEAFEHEHVVSVGDFVFLEEMLRVFFPSILCYSYCGYVLAHLLVDTLLRFPSGYRDRTVFDPWRPSRLMCHRVLEKVSIVPLRVVGPVVSLSRFVSLQCRLS